jgi:hypothetical protein
VIGCFWNSLSPHLAIRSVKVNCYAQWGTKIGSLAWLYCCKSQKRGILAQVTTPFGVLSKGLHRRSLSRVRRTSLEHEDWEHLLNPLRSYLMFLGCTFYSLLGEYHAKRHSVATLHQVKGNFSCSFHRPFQSFYLECPSLLLLHLQSALS